MTTLYVSPERVYELSLPPALLFATTDEVPTPLLPGVISDVRFSRELKLIGMK